MLQPFETLFGHEEESRVWHVSWSHNGQYIASCGEDKTIRIWSSSVTNWNADEHRTVCIATLEEGQTRTLRCCEWSPNDKMIASASFDGTVVIWESQDSSYTVWDQVTTLEGHDNEVKCVCWCPNGHLLATCGRDKRIWIWEMLRNSEFECVGMLEGHTQDIKFIQWNPTASFDMPILLSASYDNTIKVWKEDDDDWYCVDTLVGHTSTVWGLSFDVKGRKFISCSDDKSIIEWQSDGIEGKFSLLRLQI